MSLKGYQWLNDKGEVIMSFRFKDCKINIWQDTTKEELDKFKEFLREKNRKELGIDFHYNNVKDYLDIEQYEEAGE